MSELKYNIDTNLGPSFIEQIFSSTHGGVRTELYRRIIQLEEESIRQALIKLGWTPPDPNRRAPEAEQPECIYGAGCTSDCTTHCKAAIAATEPQAQAEPQAEKRIRCPDCGGIRLFGARLHQLAEPTSETPFESAYRKTLENMQIAQEAAGLKKPAEGQEPVAIVHRRCDRGFNVEWLIATFDLPHGAKLYAQPQRPAVPDDEILHLASRMLEKHVRFGDYPHYRVRDKQLIAFVRALGITAAPAPERPAIQWSDELKPNSEVHYNHLIGNTPFSRILITWKGWKDDLDMIIDEHPVESAKGKYAGGSIEEAKQTAEKFYLDALKEQPNEQG